MDRRAAWNFAARLVSHLGESSQLVDAATGQIVSAAEMTAAVTGAAAGFLSAGLRTGDRVLISCDQSPISSLIYLGAMYGGLVAVPVNARGLATSGPQICRQSGARAVWTEHGKDADWARKSGALHIEGAFRALGGDCSPPAACHVDELAALMPTSGSTGLPRLVRVKIGRAHV